ncbi:uncharacterized protein LOC142775008 [Rhipicephalus microplus]|uniref:uncharacterized protein LOC142775008 n=1 Tax=Rhipicephalus microplus TaxID=6941 RepID=UPI003F6C3313
MSTEKLQETSFLSEFSDVDLNSSQLTDEDEDEERRSLTTSSHGRRQECSKTILIASMAITLLVLSMLAIAWKKTDKREFVPPSDVVVPPVEDPPYHRVFIGRLGGAKSPRNWSTLPRNKQFMVPGMRAFAGEPTTEFSMIEIADVNFDSLRTQKTASPVTYEIGDPEVNEPFRQEAVTTHWRAALRRKDVGLTSKSLPVWNNVNDSLPVTPNLVRRFIGRRGFSTVATTTAVTTSIGSIKAIGNDNISVYVIRVGGNINGSANASRSGNSTPNAVSEIDITATSSKVTFGTVNKRFSSEGVAEPFIKWNQLPETSDNEPPSLGVTSSGAFASTSVTERVSKSVHDVNLFSEDKSVVSLTAAPTVRDTSLFGEPSIGSHEYETKGHVTTHSPVVDRRRQDINDKEIGRIVPAFDFDESQKNVSSEQSDKPKLDAHSVPPEERISRSTVIIVSYANEREGLYGSKEQNATSPSLTGFAGQKTTVVGVDVKTHRVDKEKPESLFNGINSPKHLADGTTMSEPSELLRSVSTLAAEIMFVPLNGSNITTIISDKPIDVSQNNVLSLSSSLPEKWTAANGSMLTVVSSSPTDVVSNGDRNLPTLWTFEQETEANKSARENEAVAMSSQNRSIDNGTAAIVSQPNAVTQQNESETPPMSLRDGQIQDNITLDIGHKPSEYEAASKELSLNELLNSTQATSTRYNHETILPTGSNNSLSGDIAEHSENRVESEVMSTTGSPTTKKSAGLLNVGTVPENINGSDISPLSFSYEGSHPPAEPTSSSDSFNLAMNGAKREEKKDNTKNNPIVEAINTREGVREEKAWTKQSQTEVHSVEDISRQSVGAVSKITTGFDVRHAGHHKLMSSVRTSTISSGESSNALVETSSTVVSHDVARNEIIIEKHGSGERKKVQVTLPSSHETWSTSPSALKSSLRLSGGTTANLISQSETSTQGSLRTRRRIRMSRRGRYRKRLTTKLTTVEESAAPTTLGTTEPTRNRYPPRKHAKKRHHAKLTSTTRLSSEYENTKAEKLYLKSTSSKDGSHETLENTNDPIRNARAGGETASSTSEGSYKRNIKPVEITHRHSLDEKREAALTESPNTQSEIITAHFIANDTKRNLELPGDQVNETDLTNNIYQHAGMNVWEHPNDASGLQKEHPGHKNKQRPRDNRRPRMLKHTVMTRPPYKAPIEWSAERVRPTHGTFSISILKKAMSTTTSATTSHSSITSTSLSAVTLKDNASSDATNKTLEVSNASNYAPIIRSFSSGFNDTDLNITETSSGNGSADIKHNLNDLRTLPFYFPSQQKNETESPVSDALNKDMITQTTVASVATLVSEDVPGAVVRCPTADCMEEGGRLHTFTNLTLKPCTNFYEFACSGWVRTHPYPSNRKKVSVDDLVVQIAEKKTMEFIYENVLDHATYTDPLLHNVARMFQGCSDKSFLLRNPAMALQAALDDVRLTDWPYDEEPLDLDVPEAIAFATRKMDVNPFFVPSLEIDTTTTSGWVFVIREPRAVITEDAYFAGDVVSTYQKLVMQAMSLVNSDKNIQALAEPVLYVDQEVHKMVEKNRRLTDYTREHYRKSLQHVNKRREFDVGSYLSTLMDGIAVLDNEVEFVIPTTSFLEDVQNVTMTFEKNVLLNYIGFRAVLALSPLLPHNDGRDLAHLHFAREIPTRTPAKRWRFCLRLLEGIYKLPLLQLQVESFEKKDNFHTINRTMELLKKHFFRTVRNSSRFGHSTRQMIITKLRDLKFHSFSSPLIGNTEVRERHYHGVPDVDPSNVLTDYVLTLNIVLKNYWSYYGSIGPQFRWHGSIFDTVATYNHFENTLYIPPSLFMEDVKYNTYHSPLYFPRSGRRIMEGLYGMLEREASFFGQHNEVVKASSWDYTTTDGYLSLRSCLKEQFRKAAMPHLVPGQTSGLHPSRPLRQDMKDNAIINVVIEAFKETMQDFGYKPGVFVLPGFAQTSMEQLFFLLYGASQCEVTSQEAALADEIIRASHPRRYRVNHALQNNAIFSQAFMCANTTEMNPKKKCKVW